MSERSFQEETYGRGLDVALWRRIGAFLRPHKRYVLGLAVFGVATAATDTMFPLLTRRVIDDVATHGRAVDFRLYGALYLLLSVCLAACVWSFIWFGGHIRSKVSHDIRRAAFENLQRLGFSFYDRRPVGWLMARMTSDCERLSQILTWGVLDFVWGVTLMTGIAIVLLVMNVKLALGVLAVIPCLAWVSAIFQRRILRWSRRVRKTNSRITASFNEAMMGIATTKAFRRERNQLRTFGGLTGEMYDASVRTARYTAVYLPLVLTLGSLATGVALAWGGLEVIAGVLTIGTLIAFLTYTRHFFDPIGEMAGWFAEMQMAQASAERVLGLVNEVPDVRDSEAVVARIEAHRSDRPHGVAEDGYPDAVGRIEMRDVTFRYGDDGPAVLERLNLTVEPGETIALVGPTGGGKTTIVNLVCRFYEPTTGEIRLDGIPYRERSLHWLQSQLGIVLQTPHLFAGSIGDNIAYGRRGATGEEIRAAAEVSGAASFIESMPDGYDTEVGEGGNRLSTGQKQLVSFARAVLARPHILVMDEATSSVDTETERRIQAGLARVLGGRTSFVIAHRLSTIRSADRILLIEQGRIVESGSHDALMERQGRYHQLYIRQRLGLGASDYSSASLRT